VIRSTTENTFFNLAGSNLLANDAPIGAKSIVKGTIQRKPAIFTKPKVLAGASVGVVPRNNIVNAPGKEMIRPIAAAVPTALWAG